MSRRPKTSIGLTLSMALAILGALVLAFWFPFAVAETIPKQLTPLEQARMSLEDSGSSDALDLASLRVLETNPDGTTFLAGYTRDGGIFGVISYNDSTVVASSDDGDRENLGFAGGGTDNTGYLYVEVAPQNRLGFHYCARSKVGKESTNELMEELARSCGDILE